MQRTLMSKLKEWKSSPKRKPLLLKGVRQVGKTWLLKEFGRLSYANTAYFNFEQEPALKELFEGALDPGRIVRRLSLHGHCAIEPYNTLLILDEIQACPQAVTALKYFCENAPEYHVAAAGSLLGVLLSQPASFPVGKVDFLNLEPLMFTEMLQALGETDLVAFMEDLDRIEKIPEVFYAPLKERLELYEVMGGMPEAVASLALGDAHESVDECLMKILSAHEYDFLKHPKVTEIQRILGIWKTLPAQLSHENRKFYFRQVKEGARAREYAQALGWLVSTQMVKRVHRVKDPRLPLSAYLDENAFKLYVCDVGLLRRLSALPVTVFEAPKGSFTEFKGALTENYVLQALQSAYPTEVYYYSQLKPPLEVDFLLPYQELVVPVEVKADLNLQGRSLTKYQELFNATTPLRVRFSLANLDLSGNLLNIPLFLADKTPRLIDMALRTLGVRVASSG